MSEFFAGVISGVFSWNLLIVLFSLGIISDFYSNRFFCSLFAILAVVSSVYFFTPSAKDIVIISIGYISVGLLWSFWRYKDFVTTSIADIMKSKDNQTFQLTNHMIKEISPNNMVSTIVAWVIAWPFSLVGNVLSDLVNIVFIKAYNKIYQNAVNNINK